MDATNWADNRVGQDKLEFKRNQFGFALGGPIVADRTFFFGSYEGLRENLGEASLATVPSVDARNGILPSKTVVVADDVKPFLALFPVPGQDNTIVSDNGDGTVDIAGTGGLVTNEDFFVVKLDHLFDNERLGQLSGTYNFTSGDRTPFGLLEEVQLTADESDRRALAISLTSLLSATTINQFTFGYNLTEPIDDVPVTSIEDFGSLKFIPFQKLLGVLNTGDLTTIGYSELAESFEQRSFSFKDGLSMTRGDHSLRMGVDIDYRRYHMIASTRPVNGDYDFDSFEDFLLENVNEFEVALLRDDDPLATERHVQQWLPGLYFQDNWQVRPGFTLNMGLRWEMATLPNERDDKLSNYIDFFNDAEITFPIDELYTQATTKSFSPRLGFAWAPGNRTTSLRGGFGIFYDLPTFYHYRTNLENVPPFNQRINVSSDDDAAAGVTLQFPDFFTTPDNKALLVAGPLNVWTLEHEQRNAYVYRWSLTLQRSFGPDWVATAGYTGARARHLWIQSLPNLRKWVGWPEQPTGTKVFPGGTEVINTGLGRSARLHSPRGESEYHGLALSLQKRLSQGLYVQSSYTYSKAMDQGSGITGSDGLVDSQRSIYYWDFFLEQGPAAINIKQNLATNFTYEIPGGQNLTGVAGVLAKGWQINGIVTLTSGPHRNITNSSNAQRAVIGDRTGLRPDVIGGDNNPTEGTSIGCSRTAAGSPLGTATRWYDPCVFVQPALGTFGNLGRNTLIGPGLALIDLSFFKNFELPGNEDTGLQFRAEFFNILNRVNYDMPDGTPFRSSGSRDRGTHQITRTRTPARQIKLALKFLF